MADENLIPREQITGLLLAGGAGRRVGNRDKGTLPWQDSTLAAHCAARLAPQVGQLYISCNRSQEFYASLGYPLLADLRAEYPGPLAGLETVAQRCTTEFLLIAPCDTPQLPPDLGNRLAETLLATAGAQICYASAAGRDHYLCALMRSACLTTVTPFLDSGERAVRHWYARNNAVSASFGDGTAFLNINRDSGA